MKRKYIVKQDNILGENDMGKSVYMRTGPGNRNLIRIAVCPCMHAYSLARVLNAMFARTGVELPQSRR